jgi:hypothetical protein
MSSLEKESRRPHLGAGADSCRFEGGDEDDGGEDGGDKADAEKDPTRDGPRRRRAVELLVFPLFAVPSRA